MSISSRCVNKPVGCPLTGLSVLVWSASTFSSASLSLSERLTDTGTQLENKSPRSWVCAFQTKQDIFSDILSERTRWWLTHKSLRAYKWIFGFGLGLLGFFTSSSNFWTHFIHPNVIKRNHRKRLRWRIYCLLNDFSSFHHNNFRDATSWECVEKDDCVRSCLIELTSFLLRKFDVDPIQSVLMFLPLFLMVPCKTRCFQVNFVWISVFFVHRIHRREEYSLSFSQTLTSRYQSWICDGV